MLDKATLYINRGTRLDYLLLIRLSLREAGSHILTRYQDRSKFINLGDQMCIGVL